MGSLCDDLVAETADLRGWLAPLSEEGWRTPTPAPGWAVVHQVGHLAYFDEQAVIAAQDPDRFREHREQALADPDGIADSIAARQATLSGAEALAWFDRARTTLVETMRPLDPSLRVPWYGPDMSVASSVTARIMETWAHGQDIVDGLGGSRPPSAALRHVAHIGARALPNSFIAHGLPVPDDPVRVALAGPDGNAWFWGPEDAANVVRGPALDFCLVVTQRRHPSDTAIVAVGPVAQQWMEVAQAFAGPPGAKRQPGQFANG